MTALFLIGFIFNELIHIALAYYQANGDFVTSSKQILIRTLFMEWVHGYSIFWILNTLGYFYQVVILAIFFGSCAFFNTKF